MPRSLHLKGIIMHGINLGLGRAVNSYRLSPPVTYNFLSEELPSGAVFTRASAATDVINGVLTDFSSGEPRVSAYNGFLSEVARTNSLRNGEAQGAVTGVIGSGGALPSNWNDVNTLDLVREIVGSGVVNGFSYLDIRLSGTPAAGNYDLLFDTNTQVAAASGQKWTGSFYIGLMSGSLSGISSVNVRVSGYNAGVELEGTSQALTPVIDPARYSVIRTLGDASTSQVMVGLRVEVTAAAVDATFRIAACQLEQGHGATSYIRTSGAAAMRAADVLYIPTSEIPGFNNVGTVVFSGITAKFLDPSTSQFFGNLTKHPANNDQHRFFKDPANFSYMHYQGLVGYGATAFSETNKSPDTGLGQAFSVGASWALGPGNVKVNVNGGTPTSLTLGTLPSGCTRLYIGCRAEGTNQLGGYTRQVDYYNTNRSDI